MEEPNLLIKSSPLQKVYFCIAVACSILASVLGISALFGQQFAYPIVTQIEATEVVMVYDTALCLCFASIGLLAILIRQGYITLIAATLLLFISLLTIIQHILNVNWEITRHFIFPYFTLRKDFSAKMLPLTIFCFLLTSIALFYMVRKIYRSYKNFVFVSFQGILIFSLGLLFLFGYIIHVEQNHASLIFIPMSANDSLGFILIGISIIFSVLYLDNTRPYQINKPFIIFIAAFISIIALLSWRFLIIKTPFMTFFSNLNWISTARELFFTLLFGIAIYFYQAARLSSYNVRRLFAMTRATLEATADGIVVTDRKGKIVDYNKKFLTMWQVSSPQHQRDPSEEIFEYIFEQLIHGEQAKEKFKDIKKHPEQFTMGEVHLKNNRTYEVYSHPQYIEHRIVGYVYSFHDITYLKQARDQLLHQATHDPLTGLTNRLLLFDRIEQSILQADRSQNILAVLFLDLNRFKFINDSMGHSIGDKLLKLVSKRLKKCVRFEDTLSRLGGDEFILLIIDLKSRKDAEEVANKCINSFNLPFFIENHELFLSCSIGISLYPKDGSNASTLLKNADTAMYLAKRNQESIQFYTESMHKFITTRLELENELPHVIEKNQLLVFYQPIIDIKSNTICATEALVRWNHPQYGLLNPSKFIPEAEETGIITSIGTWVLRTACLQNKYWQEKKLLTANISVNVSVKQLHDINFVKEVEKVLLESKLDAKYLELELTESRLLDNTFSISEILRQLKNKGVKIAIDDFGTGYTGLAYLKHFPLDKLKIDQSLMKNLPNNLEERAIVPAIISMCKNLNIRSVVEGVENINQFTFLKETDCDEAQGFFFSPPLSTQEYEHFISSWKSSNIAQP